MAKKIQISAEGEGAVLAVEELLAINGISGSLTSPTASSDAEREGVLAAIAAVVGIVGGATAIADKIIAWYEKWNTKPSRRLNVVIEDARGNRIALGDATAEQIAQALTTLAP